MIVPYYADELVTLYHGDCRDVVLALDLTADLIVADPPYGETSLTWDRWPAGWPTAISGAAKSMWCFGSMRMFLDRRDEFAAWRLSQDVVWDKGNGTGLAADRFRRVHEHAAHWYLGRWSDIHAQVPRISGAATERGRTIYRRAPQVQHNAVGVEGGTYHYGEPLMLSILAARNMWRRNPLHPTEKPVGILDPLIRYGCPEGGTVLDPFAGSGSTAEAARLTGRKAILIEASEKYCEIIARRMSQGVLL